MAWKGIIIAVVVALSVAVAVIAPARGAAKEAPSAQTQLATQAQPATQTQPTAEIDPKARHILRASADYLASLKAFRVSGHTTVTMVVNGKPKQLQRVATLVVERPDKFVLRVEGAPGLDSDLTTVCDGQKMYRYRPQSQRYSVQGVTAASFEKRKSQMAYGSLGGEAISMLVADDPYEAFIRICSKITYVGTETIDGIACDRVRFVLLLPFVSTIDMWIQTGPQPLPVKSAGPRIGQDAPRPLKALQAETVETLQAWSISEGLPAEVFHFEPPAEAVKVADNNLFPPPGLHPLVGKMAPDATLELLDGGQLNLSEHKGKHMVILAFCNPEWPSYSDYLPKVAEVAWGFPQEDVRFYAVCPAESRQAVQELLAKTRLDILVALDGEGLSAEKFGAMDAIPTTILIDRQGKMQVVDMWSGPGTADQLRKQIRAVLDGKDLATEAIAEEQKKPSPRIPGAKAGEQKELSPQTAEAKE